MPLLETTTPDQNQIHKITEPQIHLKMTKKIDELSIREIVDYLASEHDIFVAIIVNREILSQCYGVELSDEQWEELAHKRGWDDDHLLLLQDDVYSHVAMKSWE
jgi:hypothetical protein